MNEAALLAKMERFARMHCMTVTELGIKAVNNGALATRLKQGKTITVDTMSRVLDYMRQNGNGHAP